MGGNCQLVDESCSLHFVHRTHAKGVFQTSTLNPWRWGGRCVAQSFRRAVWCRELEASECRHRNGGTQGFLRKDFQGRTAPNREVEWALKWSLIRGWIKRRGLGYERKNLSCYKWSFTFNNVRKCAWHILAWKLCKTMFWKRKAWRRRGKVLGKETRKMWTFALSVSKFSNFLKH